MVGSLMAVVVCKWGFWAAGAEAGGAVAAAVQGVAGPEGLS